MGLVSSDILLIERGGTVYRETFGNRANIEDSDILLVEAASTDNSRTNGKVYRCTYGDWKQDISGGGGGGGGGGATHGWGSSNTSISGAIDNLTSQYNQSDSTLPYKIFSQSMSVTGGTSVTGRLYIGMRMRGTTTYYHDWSLAIVQILQSNGTSFRTDSTYSNGYDWNARDSLTSQYATSGFYNWSTSTGFTHSYSVDPSTHSYVSIGSATNARWSRGLSTGSTYTGAADGIYSPSGYSGGGGSILPASGTVSQTSSTPFLFTETSGSGYLIDVTTIWLRSPEITVHNGDILRMAYLGVGGSSSTNGVGRYDNDTIYFRFK